MPKLFYTADFAGPAAQRLNELGMVDAASVVPAEVEEAIPSAAKGFALHLAQDDSEPATPPEGDDPQPRPAMPVEAPAPPAATDDTTDAIDEALNAAEEAAAEAVQDASSPNMVEIPSGAVVRQKRLYNLVLLMDRLAQPGPNGHSYWPASLATPLTLELLAWAAAVSEFVGGICLLLGILTRLWGLVFTGVMASAAWMTQIVPAVQETHAVRAGTNAVATITENHPALLGFLPPLRYDDPVLATQAWSLLLWQLTVLAAAVALVLAGSGALSVDRAIFGSKKKLKVDASDS